MRAVYNAALEERQLRYNQQNRKSTSYAHQANQLPALKKEFPWLKEAPAQCLQQGLMDLNGAFEKFFAGTHGYPSFRRKGRNDSFRLPQPDQLEVGEDHIRLPKFGEVKYRRSRRCHRVWGEVRSITVKRGNDVWHASVNCVVEIADPVPLPPLETAVGIDRGVAVSAALSSGEKFYVPRFTPGEAKRMRRLQKRLSRQKKGSKNREKARRQISLLWGRLRHRRLDAIHRFTTRVAKNHGLIALEELAVENMTKSARGTREEPGRNVRRKAGLNRAILGQCWGEMRRQFLYKAEWYGSKVVEILPAYTSQTCSRCWHVHEENRITQALFRCHECGLEINADLNAALVIHALGVRVYACAVSDTAGSVRQEAPVQVLASAGSASRGSPSGKAGQNPRL